jgi:ferritin-like metal-binding protein YciE
MISIRGTGTQPQPRMMRQAGRLNLRPGGTPDTMESARDLFEYELSSASDAASRGHSVLKPIANKVSDAEFRSLLEGFTDELAQHTTRLHEATELVKGINGAEPSRPVRAMLDETRSMVRQESAAELLDLSVAYAAADVAQYLRSSYEGLMQLAERSGLTHSTPEVGGMIEPCLKETKRSARKLHKQIEKLVEHVRPN